MGAPLSEQMREARGFLNAQSRGRAVTTVDCFVSAVLPHTKNLPTFRATDSLFLCSLSQLKEKREKMLK